MTRRVLNTQPPDHQSDVHPADPPRPASTQSDWDFCFSIYSIVSIDSIGWQWRPWSDYTNMHADLNSSLPIVYDIVSAHQVDKFFNCSLTLKVNSSLPIVYDIVSAHQVDKFFNCSLTLKVLNHNCSRWHFDFFLWIFRGKKDSISCVLSARQIIHMKCLSLFPYFFWKIIIKEMECCLLEL